MSGVFDLAASNAASNSTAANAGAPIAFGAFNIGAGGAGGTAINDGDTVNPSADAKAVSAMLKTGSDNDGQGGQGGFGGMGGASDGGDGGIMGALGGTAQNAAMQWLTNGGFGANANDTQITPQTKIPQTMGGKAPAALAAEGEEGGLMPGPIALAGIGVAGLVVLFLVMR